VAVQQHPCIVSPKTKSKKTFASSALVIRKSYKWYKKLFFLADFLKFLHDCVTQLITRSPRRPLQVLTVLLDWPKENTFPPNGNTTRAAKKGAQRRRCVAFAVPVA